MKNTDPFAGIGDASSNHAFLTTSDGFDVAKLERITPEEWPDLEAENYLSDEAWQTTVDTVNAAPNWRDALEEIARTPKQGEPEIHDPEFMQNWEEGLREELLEEFHRIIDLARKALTL